MLYTNYFSTGALALARQQQCVRTLVRAVREAAGLWLSVVHCWLVACSGRGHVHAGAGVDRSRARRRPARTRRRSRSRCRRNLKCREHLPVEGAGVSVA